MGDWQGTKSATTEVLCFQRWKESPPLRQIFPNSIQRRDLQTFSQKNFYSSEPLGLHSSCTHRFQRLHRIRCVRTNRLHVDVHRRGDVRVAQNLLNHLVGNPESVQIGREPAPECVPAVPSCKHHVAFNIQPFQLECSGSVAWGTRSK